MATIRGKRPYGGLHAQIVHLKFLKENNGARRNPPLATDPGIEGWDASRLKVGNVARYDSHAVYKRRRSDQPITDRARVWYMEPCATLRNSHVDGQNATGEGGQDVSVQPRSK